MIRDDNTYKKQLRKFIQSSNNIFDLYLELYDFLRANEATSINAITNNTDGLLAHQSEITELLEDKAFEAELQNTNKGKLEDILNRCQAEKRLFTFAFALFNSIDNVFGSPDYRYSKSSESSPDKAIKIEPLNTKQTTRKGKVFYKQPTIINTFFDTNKFPRSANRAGSSIEGYQKNLLIFSKHRTTDYIIRLWETRHPYVTQKILKKHKINIALVPFTGDNNYLESSNAGTEFFIDGINNEAQYTTKMLRILDALKTAEADIVVFPEAVFSSCMLDKLKTYLNENKGVFTLVVAGSVWENKQNRCELLSGDGIVLGTQYKLNKFHKTADYDEPGNNEGIEINSKKRILEVYDIAKLGRVTTPICADFITPGFFEKLVAIGSNITFNPTFTSSLSHMYQHANNLGAENLGSVFIANCCSQIIAKSLKASSGQKEILFGYVPIKNIDNLDNKMLCHIGGECNCHISNACYFLATLRTDHCHFEKFKL